MQSENPSTDHRKCGGDRRQRKMPKLKYLLYGGKRSRIRRSDDIRKLVLLDTYARKYLVQISFLLFLSLVDGFLTLKLIQNGVDEAVPYWDLMIAHNPLVYLIVKYTLTAAGCIGILVAGEVHLWPSRIKVKRIFPLLITIFVLVTSVQYMMYLRLIKL